MHGILHAVNTRCGFHPTKCTLKRHNRLFLYDSTSSAKLDKQKLFLLNKSRSLALKTNFYSSFKRF